MLVRMFCVGKSGYIWNMEIHAAVAQTAGVYTTIVSNWHHLQLRLFGSGTTPLNCTDCWQQHSDHTLPSSWTAVHFINTTGISSSSSPGTVFTCIFCFFAPVAIMKLNASTTLHLITLSIVKKCSIHNRWVDGWMDDEWINGMNEWRINGMNEWMNEWMNEYGTLVEWWQGKTNSNQRSTCSDATMSTTDLTQTGLGLNLSLYGKILVTNPLSHGRAFHNVQRPSS